MGCKSFLSILILMTISIGGGNLAGAAAISDPIGDFPDADITELTTTVEQGNFNIVITFSDLPGEFSGAVFMDTDQDHTTGYWSSPGFDYVYSYNVMDIGYPLVFAYLNDEEIDSNTLIIDGNQVYISIPLSMLENDDGNTEVFVAAHTQLVKGLDFDRTPDFGVINTINGSISIPFSGNMTAGGDVVDFANDSISPNIVGFDTKIEYGMLNLVVTYDENIGPQYLSSGEDITGWIFLDTDQDLATGFRNTGQAPPTFGIDYRIIYTIEKLSSDNVVLERMPDDSNSTSSGYIETTKGILGVPYNDARLRVSGNQVFLGIPLGLIDFDEGNMDVVIDSFTMQGILDGDIDSVPDFGLGALDTGSDSIKPLLAFTDSTVSIDDPAGDSSGSGFDGDDITAVDTCLVGDTVLIKITYSSLSPSSGAFTTIMFDTDRDPENTPDCFFMYSLYSGGLSAQIFGDVNGTFTAKDGSRFVSMLGNEMYSSIPLEFLNNDDGALNIQVETSLVTSKPGDERDRIWISDPNKFDHTTYDLAPDDGHISIFPIPIAEFVANVSSGNAPLIVQFTDLSSNVMYWEWDVDGDEAIDYTSQNPDHTYDTPGMYDVSLTVGNNYGMDTEIKTAYIVVSESGDWNPWNDFDSDGGESITTSELQECINCWINGVSAPKTGAEVTTQRLQELINLWINI